MSRDIEFNSHSLSPYEHIVSTDFEGGEGVLVDLNTKKYYQLNETAMLVWRCLEKGATNREIIGEMTAEYNVTQERAAASLEKLLRHFLSHKLVRER
ncbi:MAG: PqqD family protein [Acidobacteria bacterium]|nr:PqqD family protein [Acidobacteriota bacterium]